MYGQGTQFFCCASEVKWSFFMDTVDTGCGVWFPFLNIYDFFNPFRNGKKSRVSCRPTLTIFKGPMFGTNPVDFLGWRPDNSGNKYVWRLDSNGFGGAGAVSLFSQDPSAYVSERMVRLFAQTVRAPQGFFGTRSDACDADHRMMSVVTLVFSNTRWCIRISNLGLNLELPLRILKIMDTILTVKHLVLTHFPSQARYICLLLSHGEQPWFFMGYCRLALRRAVHTVSLGILCHWQIFALSTQKRQYFTPPDCRSYLPPSFGLSSKTTKNPVLFFLKASFKLETSTCFFSKQKHQVLFFAVFETRLSPATTGARCPSRLATARNGLR